ncbi:hypothetical protein [Cellulomonas sp. NPDC058312]|uniref:hypothetical protein n=1 Tax=Cellulomonas sp. NPDC058312 TaxID=3346441 RepID=UPI0036EBBB64
MDLPMPNPPIVFLDTETTGLHADRRPWEIAMIRREHGQEDRSITIQISDVDLSTAELIGLNIGRFYERHHQYVMPDVARPQDFRAVYEPAAAGYVEAWTRGAHIVGLVPNFDTECLAAMLRRHNLSPAWHYHLIDVETMTVGWLAQARRSEEIFLHNATPDLREHRGTGFVDRYTAAMQLPWSSEAMSRWCDVEPPTEEERHTAMGDARWAQRWYDALTGNLL